MLKLLLGVYDILMERYMRGELRGELAYLLSKAACHSLAFLGPFLYYQNV